MSTEFKRYLIKSQPEIAIETLLNEATNWLDFSKNHWDSNENHAGLADAGARLTKQFLDEFGALIESLRDIQIKYRAIEKSGMIPVQKLNKGRHLLNELNAFIFWYRETEEHNWGILHAIERVEAATPDDLDSPHALAYALYNYATVSNEILALNGTAGNISRKTTKAAYDLASELIDRSRGNTQTKEDILSMAALRRKLTLLLTKKMNFLKRTIQFIFRHHPSLIAAAEATFETTTKFPKQTRKHPALTPPQFRGSSLGAAYRSLDFL